MADTFSWHIANASGQLFHHVDMGCQEKRLVEKVCDIYDKILKLENLIPSTHVDTLFTQLVLTCIAPSPIDVSKLSKRVQEIRSNLIKLCGEAEGLLESHFSTIIGSNENPFNHLNIFPYYSNYLKLSQLEFTMLSNHFTGLPNQIAFIGSGPLPLTSIMLASYHLRTTFFHNYDIDSLANSKALRLVSSHPDLSKRMFFHTADIMNVTNNLKEYEVVFLAALVGMSKEQKAQVIDHLGKHMAPGALLVLRSANGARAFLYPVIDPCDLQEFEVLSVYHPTDEIINSVIIARKYPMPIDLLNPRNGSIILPGKCSEIQHFNPLNHGSEIEEFAIDEKLS
ncbi:hypothetical protein F0562_034903 [Nyssa sinensis]|uniref:Nicotianamine synthase n=1 Tax=Nyssa sinensis TaxID=561372 RepID=A0A5J5AC04_9ASTE|nr:hypothetical protein F0562_034903 [Nyssa sinensis]